MAPATKPLPQEGQALFLTDGGIETSLIFLDGIDLPYFAAFDLLKTREGTAALVHYYERYIAIAKAQKRGFILESPTWRASPDWAEKLGYSKEALIAVNRDAIGLMTELKQAHESADTPMVISGCVGPRGDGYAPDRHMQAAEAEAYHAPQIRTYGEEGADMITAITMTYAEEAIGIARAAAKAGCPSAISFTVETDGRLPSGQSLKDAIAAVDAAAAPAYYMINCAHPAHFDHVFEAGESWLERLRGLRANASTLSHAELDNASELDAGDPADLGRRYAALRMVLPNLTVLGGCCGTDHRHVTEMARACAA